MLYPTQARTSVIVVVVGLTLLSLLVGQIQGGNKSRRQANGKCKRLKKNDYELYGTKTDYDVARDFIGKLKDAQLAESFDDDTLEEEHKDLVEDNCTPVMFYFFGRHAARFPDAEDIELFNKELYDLKGVLKQNGAEDRCPEKFVQFLNWTSKMEPKMDNLITDIGAKQQRDIAKRFRKIYPEFFDGKKTDINIGVTTKFRTAQTAAEFLKEVNGLNIPNCEGSLPTNDVFNKDYNLDKVLQNTCYKSLLDKYNLPFLEFHKQCDKIQGKQKVKDPIVEKVNDPRLLHEVIEKVSEKLELPKGKEVNTETLEAILDMCRFENAFRNTSVWCNLFEKKDIETLEYIKDTEVYIKNAYGPQAKPRQACLLIKDLVENFEKGLSMTGRADEKRKAFMYFSHAGTMKKLLAAFNVFQDNDSYTANKIDDFVNKSKVDKEREWRTSLIIPFSANMAFVLYRCQKPGKEVKHKILSTVTERPVKLGKCKDTHCSSKKFFEAFNGMRDCDLNKICAQT